MVFQKVYSAFKTSLFIFLLNDYLKRCYPEKYNQTLIFISYNAIYMYSRAQIIYNKLQRFSVKYIKSNANILSIVNYFYKIQTQSCFEVIKNGEITKLDYAIDEEMLNRLLIVNDFIIYSDNSKLTYENKCVNKSIISKDVNNTINDIQKCEISNIQFMLVEFIIGEDTFKINLKDEKYNYYIVNNIFTKKFFIYYLKNHLPNAINYEDIFSTEKSCSLKIIDHNITVFEMNLNKEVENIKIEKNGYMYNKELK